MDKAKLFSQRMGLKPVKNVIQLDTIDNDLKIGLWNTLDLFYWNRIGDSLPFLKYFMNMSIFCKELWHNYFKLPIDTIDDYWPKTYKMIREYFFKCEWYEIYDFIEFVANNYPDKSVNQQFIKNCNIILEKELSAYRFVGEKITKVTSEEEILEIEEALQTPLAPVREHLKCALGLLSDKKSPNYRNSVKESISAVESICKVITGNDKATLGDALKEIERENKIELHPALKKSFSSLYGYTNDAEGIRHALKLDESSLNFEDAKFMLVSCSAFVNYLLSKSSKARIKL